MGTIERDLREAFEDERGSVTTPATLLESVTSRVRRRRIGALAGTTVGTLGVVGLAAAIPLVLAHGGPSSVGPGATPTAMDVMPENPLGLRCGDPVPASLASGPHSEMEAFTMEIVVETTTSSGSETPVVIMTRGSDVRPPASEDGAETIVARGGVVVGWTGVATHEGSPSLGTTSVEYSVWVCPAARNDTSGGFQSGSYIEYPIAGERPTP